MVVPSFFSGWIYIMCVDKVLDVNSIIRKEFFTVAFAYLENSGLDNFIAPFHAIVQFLVGGVIGHGGDRVGIYSPVEIEFHK